MDRIAVYRYDEPLAGRVLAGYFNRDAATRVDEETRWDGNNHVSVHTSDRWEHQQLYRTSAGRWVLSKWSQRVGRGETFEFVTDDEARDWLIVNGDEDTTARYFGEIPEERGPGRPAIGPVVEVRFAPDILEAIDAAAAVQGMRRAEYIRGAVERDLSVTARA